MHAHPATQPTALYPERHATPAHQAAPKLQLNPLTLQSVALSHTETPDSLPHSPPPAMPRAIFLCPRDPDVRARLRQSNSELAKLLMRVVSLQERMASRSRRAPAARHQVVFAGFACSHVAY